MGFMRAEILDKQKWYSVDGSEGISFFPADCFNKEEAKKNYPGKPDSVKTVWGYGARLSAPGYLDATEWCVFSSLKKAKDYIDETFGEG